ncbi:MAG: hypothetical protein NZ899_13990 [Thermoguttaceae bacterium]|nr:hypothetical protein [Thermoguttaceae bacterium]MDW8080107.1 hypothetical protein [Thermoguttaceae bacterium]
MARIQRRFRSSHIEPGYFFPKNMVFLAESDREVAQDMSNLAQNTLTAQ